MFVVPLSFDSPVIGGRMEKKSSLVEYSVPQSMESQREVYFLLHLRLFVQLWLYVFTGVQKSEKDAPITQKLHSYIFQLVQKAR